MAVAILLPARGQVESVSKELFAVKHNEGYTCDLLPLICVCADLPHIVIYSTFKLRDELFRIWERKKWARY